MLALTRFVLAHRWWVIGAWLLLAVAGGLAAPHATARLSYDFGLPGQPGYETNRTIVDRFGSGGENAPVLVVVGDGSRAVPRSAAAPVVRAALAASPGARVASFADEASLRGEDGRLGVVLVYPRPLPNAPDPYAQALPAIEKATGALSGRLDQPIRVTGEDALSDSGGGGGANVLVETLAGGIGALVVLVVVFGSFLALTPLLVAAASILTTFLVLWGLTSFTSVSFIVQYLLALIGLGVAIDYSLLVVTRWREERGNGEDESAALERAMATAGRSVVFSGVTVAVSLAALIALPVPFLRSVGFTGLLIPLISVVAALTLLPAVLAVAGPRLSWPHRRRTDPSSHLWDRVGHGVVRHRWVAIGATAIVLLALASPVLGLRLGAPTNDSLASTGGSAATAIHQVQDAGIGAGITQPVEVVTRDAGALQARLDRVEGVATVLAPPSWTSGGRRVVDVWSTADASSATGSATAARVREVADARGAQVGGLPAQNADFVTAVYGNAWWIGLIIVVVTLALLARALHSIWLPVKALVLNVVSIAAAYGATILIWQHGVGTQLLFDESAAGAVTVWVPIAVFAFLFGLSMDYEVFLLSRIREEHDGGHPTDEAAVRGLARTGRLVTSAALILVLAFVSLSRVPSTDVKILATGLAFGIAIDATIVRGLLAPALVAALGRANWWWPTRPAGSRPGRARTPRSAPAADPAARDVPPPGR